jgi:phage tail sheath gpL-like
MVAAYLKANKFTKMMAIGVLDSDAGERATGKLTFAGAVTAAAPLNLYLGGSLLQVGTNVGQTAEAVAANVVTAINADANLAVTATQGVTEEVPNGEVILTAKHAGECGNDIDLRFNYQEDTFPGGLDLTFTPMAGGSGNPAPGPTIAVWGGERYHIIAWPWTDTASLNALKVELDERWGPLRQIDGQAITVKTGSFVQVTNFTRVRNDKHLTVFPSEGSPTPPWIDAASSAGIIAYYGASDPVRPFQTLTIPGVLAPAVKDRWADFPEKNQALFEGCSVRRVNDSGEVMILNAITTYKTNAWGASTQAYLQLNTLLTLSKLRYTFNARIQLKYPRCKLASDDVARTLNPGQPVVTPSIIKAETIAFIDECVREGLVEAPADFASKLIVERDTTNQNRLNIYMSPDLVNQFRVCATLISFLL